jgi:hypothetical protein
MNYQRNCSILTIINEITLYNSAIITYFYVYTYTQRSIHNVPNPVCFWLSQAQMAELFGTRRQAITKHLKHSLLAGICITIYT